ncbi:hypothetical protein [Streptomyces sp. SDr-06]|uniref:hypothetical protein n=1 Tax=Streptomyces sp. SDr-06 TaxID=2267702 RepID=UPI0011C066C8|nr:hypothetical protein [Streptomyces sp. SDr-06]
MTNLPIPVMSTAAPGNFLTSALWNAQVRDAINFVLNPPIFFGYSTSTVSLAAGVFTAIGLDTEVFDSYGGHSTVTNTSRYVAQVAGVYEVIGAGSLQSTSGTLLAVYVGKNGTIIPGSEVETPPMSTHFNGISSPPAMVQLNVGDYVETYVLCSSAASTANGGPWCSLSVKFIHP